jgi:hypothetical protein
MLLAKLSSNNTSGMQVKVAARVTIFCALRSKHRGASTSTSASKVVTMRDMLRVWDERMSLLQHKPSTSMAPMTMRCAYLETVNHWPET